jgi:hypothetical protein
VPAVNPIEELCNNSKALECTKIHVFVYFISPSQLLTEDAIAQQFLYQF